MNALQKGEKSEFCEDLQMPWIKQLTEPFIGRL